MIEKSELMWATLRALDRQIDRRLLLKIDIATASGIPARKVGELLRGTQEMKLEEYFRICDAIGVDPTVPLAIASAEIYRKERRNTNE